MLQAALRVGDLLRAGAPLAGKLRLQPGDLRLELGANRGDLGLRPVLCVLPGFLGVGAGLALGLLRAALVVGARLLSLLLRPPQLGLSRRDAGLCVGGGRVLGALGLLGDPLLRLLAKPLGLRGELLLRGRNAVRGGKRSLLDLLETPVRALDDPRLVLALLGQFLLRQAKLVGEAVLGGVTGRIDLLGGACGGLDANAVHVLCNGRLGLGPGLLLDLGAGGGRGLQDLVLELAANLLARLGDPALDLGLGRLGRPAVRLGLGGLDALLGVGLRGVELLPQILGLGGDPRVRLLAQAALGLGLGLLGRGGALLRGAHLRERVLDCLVHLGRAGSRRGALRLGERRRARLGRDGSLAIRRVGPELLDLLLVGAP